MEIPNFSHLRSDLAKALYHKEKLFKEGLKHYSEENHIKLSSVLQKLTSVNDPLFVVKIRRYIDDYTQNVIPRPSEIAYKREIVENIAIEWIKAKAAPELPLILHFHGGGYVFGGLDARWQLPSQLSKIANVNILSVNYSLAPEFPYPAALNDAEFVYEYLLNTKNIDPNSLLVSGASAGGGLALALLLKLRDENKPLPAGAALFSPWTGLTFTGKSYKTNKKTDPDVVKKNLELQASAYVGSAQNRKNPYISPVFGDFTGLPPLLVDVGGLEILLDDSKHLVEKAIKAEVEINFKEWKDMNHVFHKHFAYIPESNQAFQRVAEFVKKVGK